MALADTLFLNKKNGAAEADETLLKAVLDFCEPYKTFLDGSKTEREAVETAVRLAEEKGYRPFETGKQYAPGEKIYYNNRGKGLILSTIGTASLAEGVHIVAAHVDSPRLDLKQCPMYETDGLAYFKTHYYGGIRKYQWPTIPLALHGVFSMKDGSLVKVNLGEDENDPVLFITDLLPHLGDAQAKRPLYEGIKGEELNIVIGSFPYKEDGAENQVKLNALRLLNEKYGITEADFLSAELEVVPAFKAKDVGFDRSMIGAYGHDDRVDAYTALMAELDCSSPYYTTCTILADKEETGSAGTAGLHSRYCVHYLQDLAEAYGVNPRELMRKSRCLSADVNAALDPTFPEVHERNNAAFLNCGVCVAKYTGARGKSGTNDASAEMVGYVRRVLDEAGVVWQTGELGKVDQGGGGTVAMYVAEHNIETLDIGVPMLAMHAPYELVAKFDVYMANRAFAAFLAAR